MPRYANPNRTGVTGSIVDSARAGLRRLAQPSDDSVWKARLMGGLSGMGEGLLDLAVPEEPDWTPDLTGGLASAGSRTIAPEAYRAVQGIKGLYSRLTDAATRLPDVMGSSKEVLAALKGLQAPAEEIAWRKLPEMLDNRYGKVTRSEVLEHLEDNPIELTSKILVPDAAEERRIAKYTNRAGYGGKNYQERITRLPTTDAQMQRAVAHNRTVEDLRDQMREAIHNDDWDTASDIDRVISDLQENPPDLFRGPHYSDISNVLGWTRSNEFNVPSMGGRGRLAQTTQSDWHQLGSAWGYEGDPETVRNILVKKKRALEDEAKVQSGWHPWDDTEAPEPWASELSRIDEKLDSLGRPVPNAPFKKDWPGLLMKQELLDVAEDPKLNWFGVLDAPSQQARWAGPEGSFDSIVNKQVSQLGKAMRPFGVEKVEPFGIPFPKQMQKKLKIYPIELNDVKALHYGKSTEHTPSFSMMPGAGDQAAQQILEQIRNQSVRPLQSSGLGVRLSPETKALIKKYGFPAFAAIMGLQNSMEQE